MQCANIFFLQPLRIGNVKIENEWLRQSVREDGCHFRIESAVELQNSVEFDGSRYGGLGKQFIKLFPWVSQKAGCVAINTQFIVEFDSFLAQSLSLVQFRLSIGLAGCSKFYEPGPCWINTATCGANTNPVMLPAMNT